MNLTGAQTREDTVAFQKEPGLMKCHMYLVAPVVPLRAL